MREIKFRGQDVETKEWYYGGIHQSGKDFDIIDDGGRYNERAVISETVGQYTGLKDKNDKEIYEGDIVKFNQHMYEGKAEVIFDYGMFVFKEFIPYIAHHLYMQISDIEVIGNIYENPNLLKEA